MPKKRRNKSTGHDNIKEIISTKNQLIIQSDESFDSKQIKLVDKEVKVEIENSLYFEKPSYIKRNSISIESVIYTEKSTLNIEKNNFITEEKCETYNAENPQKNIEEISHLKGLSNTFVSDDNDEIIQIDNIKEIGKHISSPGLNDPQFPDVDLIPGGDLELENWMDL